MFAAIVAPRLFTQVYEYPILIAAALLALPRVSEGGAGRAVVKTSPVLLLGVLVLVARFGFGIELPATAELPFQILLVALVAVMLLQREQSARFIALVVLGFLVTGLWQPGFNRVAAVRSLFGVSQVIETTDRQFRLLYHGTTLHGAERIADTTADAMPEPLTYYYRGGPISDVIDAVRGVQGSLRHVAVVGLGTGALACYRHRGEAWTFYEIDPAVVQIGRDPHFFTFISACAPDLPVAVGDARLTLAVSTEKYDLIVLDAFSSDTIPAHLLTREAVAGYRNHLYRRRRYLDAYLQPLHGTRRHGCCSRRGRRLGSFHQDRRPDADFVTRLQDERRSGRAGKAPRGRRRSKGPARLDQLRAETDVEPWTDDYSNILGAIISKQRERWRLPAWAEPTKTW
jgi:hypothetical protein